MGTQGGQLTRPPADASSRALLGGLGEFGRDAPAFLRRVAAENGPIASVRLGRQTMVLIASPELIDEVMVRRRLEFVKAGMRRAKALIGEGLLTSEGPFHDRQRRLAEPAFAGDWVPRAAPVATSYAEQLADRWSPGQTVDIGAEMLWLTGHVIARLLLPNLSDPVLARVVDALTAELDWLNRYPEQLAVLDRLPLPANVAMKRAKAELVAWVATAQDEAMNSERDLLARLKSTMVEGQSMTPYGLTDEALTILLAAHEPPAMALTWSLYLLARHPEVARAVGDEARAAPSPRSLLPSDVPLAGAVVREAVRLYPPVWLFARQPLEDLELGGYAVRRGTWVLISPYVMHHLPDFWPAAERFDPQRWTTNVADDSVVRGAYLPFGRGPRTCIGERLAWQTVTVALATICRRFRPAIADPAWQPLTSPTIILRPRTPLHLTLQSA